MTQTASVAKATTMIKTISDESTLFGYIGEILKYAHNPLLPITSRDMDDCALMKISDTESLAITSDFVRGSGFTLFGLGLMNYYDAGYYLISANISDLASTGARSRRPDDCSALFGQHGR
jgi:thiamine monophosphate kinase